MNVRAVALGIAALVSIAANAKAFAGPNDFFGSTIGGQPETAQGGQAAMAAPQPTTAPAGDYTGDEKRMQKKFRANLKAAKQLVAKAEKMIKSTDTKIATKGKILKEIGEKRVAELNANNPFPELAGRGNNKLQ